MNGKHQAFWMVAAEGYFRSHRALDALVREERGVTSIEYALLGSLIAIGALIGITTLGSAVAAMWTGVASAVTAAM